MTNTLDLTPVLWVQEKHNQYLQQKHKRLLKIQSVVFFIILILSMGIVGTIAQ